jgi:cell wall-associated NlpC family hydrolase
VGQPAQELDDIRRIPQDVGVFARAFAQPLTEAEQIRAVQQFRAHYFSPWTAGGAIHRIGREVAEMRRVGQRTHYADNRLPVPRPLLNGVLADAALDKLPSMNQAAVVIAPSFLRALPWASPWFETADDFPFDQLQYSELKPNDPVRILHASASGAWLFVDTAYGLGWVQSTSVLPLDAALQQRLMAADWVVVVKDFAELRDAQGRAVRAPKLGTLYPLLGQDPEHWQVGVATFAGGDEAELRPARIAKADARRFPLPMDAQSLALVGNALLGGAYGWGEVFRHRDCSATTRDFFMPFGIWLPRNSKQQIDAGPAVWLAGLPSTDKKQQIIEQGVPFRTLVHRKGHIMLYVGQFAGEPVVLQNTWAIRYRGPGGQEAKFYIGRTVLTTLQSGSELPLTRGTNLDHVDSLLNLPAGLVP